MRLSQFKQGAQVKIVDLSSVSSVVQQRLIQLGVCAGTDVCIVNKMPFGGPLMVEACGQCVGIRRKDAAEIQVALR